MRGHVEKRYFVPTPHQTTSRMVWELFTRWEYYNTRYRMYNLNRRRAKKTHQTKHEAQGYYSRSDQGFARESTPISTTVEGGTPIFTTGRGEGTPIFTTAGRVPPFPLRLGGWGIPISTTVEGGTPHFHYGRGGTPIFTTAGAAVSPFPLR